MTRFYLNGRKLRVAAVLSVLALLLFSTSTSILLAAALSNPSASSPSTYGLADLSQSDKISLVFLEQATGNSSTVSSYEAVIEKDLLPLSIQEVLLDIGWQNYSVGKIPYEPWVANWLTASDLLGVKNVIYVGQLTQDGVGSPWVMSVIEADPSAQTFYSNGTAANFVSYDSPDVAHFIESDLGLLYSYYGSYPSWVAIGTGSTANSPYYADSEAMPIMGYSNQSVTNFLDSVYYSRLVNSTGQLANGAADPLWSSYNNVSSSISLSSGEWDTSSSSNVFGSGSASSYIEMRFYLPEATQGLRISWYGSVVGDAGNLTGALYADANGSIDYSAPLGNASEPSTQFTTTDGWQAPFEFQGSLPAGYYWVVFASPESDNASYYSIYLNDYVLNGATALARQAYVGGGFLEGSSILWMTNQSGATVELYPYEQVVVQPSPSQVFTAPYSFDFNTVFLFLSDRDFNPTNGTIIIQDVSEGNTTVATGVLSQSLVHGLDDYVPISLSATVQAVAGQRYLISIVEPDSGSSWRVVLRGVETSPASAGFQGQTSSLLFELADVNWVQGHVDFTGLTSNGGSPVTAGDMNAVRIIPTSNETLQSLKILTYSTVQTGYYSSGSFTVGIWSSSSNGSSPQSPIQQISIPATQVPANGFLNVTGFSVPVSADQPYWIVFSTNSTQGITFARLTSTYNFLVLASNDGGKNWAPLADGPTEFAFVVTLSQQELGNYIAGFVRVLLSTTTEYAQSFLAAETGQVSGIYIGPLHADGDLRISIVGSTTDGEPSSTPITSTIYDTDNITLDYGLDFIQFQTVARLQAGVEYWIVIDPLNSSSYEISPIAYLPGAPGVPANASALVSSDGGAAWSSITNGTSMLSYELTSPPVSLPNLTTQEVYQDLSANENYSTASGILEGWNAFVQASELQLFSQITGWLNSNTSRDYTFVTNAQSNVSTQTKPSGVTVLSGSSSSTSCDQLVTSVQSSMILSGTQDFSVPGAMELSSCGGTAQSVLKSLGTTKYVGGYLGAETGSRVLVVGDGQTDNLTRYLSTAYNTSYTDISVDPSLQGVGSLSVYSAVIWEAHSSPFSTVGLESLLLNYTSEGGTLIVEAGGGSGLTGNASIAIPLAPSNTSYVRPVLTLLKESLFGTGYNSSATFTVQSSTNGTVTAPGLNMTLELYGMGRLVVASFDEALSQVSEQTEVLSNLVGMDTYGGSPFWYGGASTPVQYGMYGQPGGPILVWFVNPTGSTATISLDLNSSAYGLGEGWSVVNVNDLSTYTGSTGVIQLNETLASYNSSAIYLLPFNPEMVIEYSNADVARQLVYPDQSLFTIESNAGMEVLTYIHADANVSQVIVNGSTPLAELGSLSGFRGATSGWYLDQSESLLLVKFPGNGSQSLRVLLSAPPEPTQTNPERYLLFGAAILVATELLVISYKEVRTRSKGGEESRGDGV